MRSQPNLASKSESVSIYKCPKHFVGPSPEFGAQNMNFLTTFFAISALDTACLWNETSHQQTKMLMLTYLLNVNL